MILDDLEEALRARRVTHANVVLEDGEPVVVIVLQDGGQTLVERRGDSLGSAFGSILEALAP